jgi:rod shape determining protein RodA
MTLQAARKTIASFDYLLFGAVLLLVAIGVIFIHSASTKSGQYGEITLPYDWAEPQLRWTIIAVGVFFVILVPRYTRLSSVAYAFYILVIVLLVVTLFIGVGPERAPVKRWLQVKVGGFHIADFQPSQLMQVALVLAIAKFLMFKKSPGLGTVFAVLVMAGVPMLLVLKQPDLGTALLFAPLPFMMLLAAGARIKHLLAIFLSGLAAVPFFWHFGMASYQKMRFLAWLDPYQFERSEGWQYIHSRIAVGSGGVFGRGLGQGTQNSLNYLSERHTDFIFSVILEESGFLGGLLIVSLYLVIVLCGLGIAARTREPFGRLVVIGIVSLLATQVFVNMGMNIGLMPITGLTLPFISYGGSSLLASFIAVGIMMNVAVHPVMVLSRDGF